MNLQIIRRSAAEAEGDFGVALHPVLQRAYAMRGVRCAA
jgi:hypothetical protein